MTVDHHRLSVAPMMDWTDRHCRFFHRLLSRHVLLYTEMVVTGALIHGDRRRWLAHAPEERPLVLQVGGDDPRELAAVARMAEESGFAEVNLNVGCPSDRVQSGRFGACLMYTPEVVAEAVAAMIAAVRIPVTVKHRLGVDDLDRYEDLLGFVDAVATAGCRTFVVHARKAWLSGLSPRENREIPPLRHDLVHRLKQDRPGLSIELNGGVQSLDEALEHLDRVDGVMLGRAAYHDPYLLARTDHLVFGEPGASAPSRAEVLERWLPYAREEARLETPLHRVTRPLHGLFRGQPGARRWRRLLQEDARRGGLAVIESLVAAACAAEAVTSDFG